MHFVDSMIMNIILLLFPLTVYSVYMSYTNLFNKEEKNVYLDLALLTSLFLIIRNSQILIITLLFINIPLLIAYLKKRNISIIVLSFIILYYHYLNLNILFYYFILEYIIYFIIYIIIRNKKINNSVYLNIFISIKSFLLSFIYTLIINPKTDFFINIIELIIIIIIFIIITYLIISIIKKADSVLEINSIIKELDNEKSLKLSLFKLAHEVKNPIAVCKGYLEMLDYNTKDKNKQYIEIIKSEIDRSLAIISDFSDYGRLKIEKELVDLSVLLEEIYNIVNPIFNENDIITKFNYIDDEIYLELDYNRIKQVLINVLKNSIEAKKEHQKMYITLDVKESKNYIELIIRDTGIGMSRKTLSKISEVFYTTKQNGTGLGVVLSKEIIKLHGGSMNYKSKLGIGTTVTIKLPKK